MQIHAMNLLCQCVTCTISQSVQRAVSSMDVGFECRNTLLGDLTKPCLVKLHESL